MTNVGAVAEPLGNAYGVGLGLVGVFTTSLFLVHALVQVPGGRLVDRHGAGPVAFVSLLLVAGGNALLMVAPEPALGIGVRALVGLGTGAAFVAGSDYVRGAGGGQVAQGVYGGSAMAGGGLALAVVPALHSPLDWRAPFAGAVAVAAAAVLVLALGPRPPRVVREEGAGDLRRLLRDRRLDRLSVAHMASLGLNAVVANWTVTLLTRAGDVSLGIAGVASALTLAAGIAGRPLGGWLALRSPGGGRSVIALSLTLGAAGTALLISARPLPFIFFVATLVGVGAGLAFAPVFAAAAALRPEEPAAAVGLVNTAGNLVIVAGTPLLGLAFALPGEGRLGFGAVAALWAAALLALPRRFELAEGEVTETSEGGIRLSHQSR